MKKLYAILCVVLFAGPMVLQAQSKKININHKGKAISVSINAIQAHLDHGDEVICDTPGFIWDSERMECIAPCEPGFEYNPISGACESICDEANGYFYDLDQDACIYDRCFQDPVPVVTAIPVSGLYVNCLEGGEEEMDFHEAFLATFPAMPELQVNYNGEVRSIRQFGPWMHALYYHGYYPPYYEFLGFGGQVQPFVKYCAYSGSIGDLICFEIIDYTTSNGAFYFTVRITGLAFTFRYCDYSTYYHPVEYIVQFAVGDYWGCQ